MGEPTGDGCKEQLQEKQAQIIICWHLFAKHTAGAPHERRPHQPSQQSS